MKYFTHIDGAAYILGEANEIAPVIKSMYRAAMDDRAITMLVPTYYSRPIFNTEKTYAIVVGERRRNTYTMPFHVITGETFLHILLDGGVTQVGSFAEKCADNGGGNV